MTSRECEKYMADVLAGRSSGLQRIYEEYSHAVYALALSVLKNRHSAEDATQKVFVRVWVRADTYRFGSNPRAWIMSIARNLSVDLLRKAGHETPEETIEAEGGGRGPADDAVDDKLELEEALQSLPELDREIFVMRFVGDVSYPDISRVLKMPLATVAFRCSRSAKRLRELLKDHIQEG